MQGSYKNNEQMIAYDAKREACQSMELRKKKILSPINPRKETGAVERKGNEEKGVLRKK
jgi:hypothetical protein